MATTSEMCCAGVMPARHRRLAASLAIALALSGIVAGSDRAGAAATAYPAVILNGMVGVDRIDAYVDGALVASGLRFGQVSPQFTVGAADGHDGAVYAAIPGPPATVAARTDTPIEPTQFLGDPRPGFISHTDIATVIRLGDKGPGSKWFALPQEALVPDFSCPPTSAIHGIQAAADISATDGFAGGSSNFGFVENRRSVPNGYQHQVVVSGGASRGPTPGDSEFAFGSFDFGLVTYRIGEERLYLTYGYQGTYGVTEIVIDCATSNFVSNRSPSRNPRFPTSRYVSLDPIRLFDTRSAAPPSGGLAPGSTLDVQVTDRVGIPTSGVSAVVLNVTATNSQGPGFVTVSPTGAPRPLTSNLNLTGPGQTIPNLVTVPVGDDGKVSFYSLSGVDLLADVAGYFVEADSATAGRFVPLEPTRVFDTRETPAPNGPVGPDASIRIPFAGEAGIPSTGADAVVLNVTGVNVGGPSFVTVSPGGATRPEASNLNLMFPGDVAPNLVIVPLGDDGSLEFYSLSGDHVIADVFGYFTDDTAASSDDGLFVPTVPIRVTDTRPTSFDFRTDEFIAANSELVVALDGAGDVPEVGAAAALLNVTATESAAAGFVTIWPSDLDRPKISNLNQISAGVTRPNAALVPLSDIGDIKLFSLGGVHAIVDVFGYFTG